MTVAEMLSRISARELSMWMAYEQAFGPLDNRYRDDVAAATHEMLQTLRHFMGEIWVDGNNPAPEPKQLARPNEYYSKARHEDDNDSENESADSEVVDIDEFNSLF
jgi:hypothetical protein